MEALIRRESLDSSVTPVHTPLEPGSWPSPWYSTSAVVDALDGVGVDHLLVDGPPAGSSGPAEARYPALPHILEQMTPDSTVVLDDALRSGERSNIRRWEDESSFRFKIRGVRCDAAVGRRTENLTL